MKSLLNLKEAAKFTMMYMVDRKKGVIYFNNLQINTRIQDKKWVDVPQEAFSTPGKFGFEALHEKFEILAQMHKFEMQPFVEMVATSSIIRRIYLTRDCGIPPYVAQIILKMLMESKACVGATGSLRKTDRYMMYLRNVVEEFKTVASITSSATAKRRYNIPQEVHDMSTEQLQLELEAAEELGAKKVVLDKLRKLFHAAQKFSKMGNVETGKTAKKMSEVDRLLKDSKEQEAVEAEYDDVPSSKKRRK